MAQTSLHKKAERYFYEEAKKRLKRPKPHSL